MSELVLEKLLEVAPQLGLLILFLISLWMLIKEYRSLRSDIDISVEDAVDAKLGSIIGKVQIESAKVTDLLGKIREIQNDAQNLYQNFEKYINERSEKLSNTLGEVEKKLELLGQAIPKDIPYSARDYAVLARQATSLGEMIDYIEKAKNDPDATSKDLEALGDTARKLRKWRIAKDLYQDAIRKDPDNFSAQMELYCLIIETNAEEREERLKQAHKLVLDKLKGSLLSRLSNTFIELNWYQRLEKICGEILEKDVPKESGILTTAHRNLAVALKSQLRYKESEKHFLKALEVDPENENTLKGYLGLLTSQGSHDEALKLAIQLLEIDPIDPNYYIFVGRELYALGRFSESDFWYSMAENFLSEGAKKEIVRRERMKASIREEISPRVNELIET